MTYSQETLQQIEQLASLYMSVSDMAAILGLRAENLRRDLHVVGSPLFLAYHRGKAASKLELRKQEMLLAKVGSPLALENCRRALIDMEDDE